MRLTFGGYRFVIDEKPAKKAKRPDPLMVLIDGLLEALSIVKQTKDEKPGHEFHGNQWTGGMGAKPETVKAKGTKSACFELLSSGHGFTLEELGKITGSTVVQLKQAIAMLQNPKWAGKQGVLAIEKIGNEYGVKVKPDTPTEEKKEVQKYLKDLEDLAEKEVKPEPPPADKPDPDDHWFELGKGHGEIAHPPMPGETISKAAADEAYKSFMDDVMTKAQKISKVIIGGFEEQENIALLAEQFKKAKAYGMAQWAANTQGKPIAPKQQAVFLADKQLIKDLQTGMDYEQALAAWKKNTNDEKLGNFPKKEPINPKPKTSSVPKDEPFVAHGQNLVAPAEYVPPGWSGVQLSQFKKVGSNSSVFGKAITELSAVLTENNNGGKGGSNTDDSVVVQNKVNIQHALEARLMDSPAFESVSKEHKKAKGGSLAAALISSWASSSGDHRPVSVANQLAVRDVFGMNDKDVDKSALHLLVSTKGDEEQVYSQAANELGVRYDTEDRKSNFKAGLRDFALAQYQNTQDHFKKLGITEVSVARGMKILHSSPADKVKLKLQPASSFSANLSTANNFSGGQSLYFCKVPASQVLGTYLTGFGCTMEHEVVVLAHHDLKAFRTKAGMYSMQAVAEHIHTHLGAKGEDHVYLPALKGFRWKQ